MTTHSTTVDATASVGVTCKRMSFHNCLGRVVLMPPPMNYAAGTLGANRIQVLRRITLPSVKNGLIAGFVIGFFTSFEELTVA